METISGEGELYDTDEKQIIANVRYEIYYTLPSKHTLGEWHGSFVPVGTHVFSLGEHILFLQDGRKGKVIISRIGVGSEGFNHYEFQGSGPIK
jgi:hypothetical protein